MKVNSRVRDGAIIVSVSGRVLLPRTDVFAAWVKSEVGESLDAAAFGNFWLLAVMLFLVGGAVQPMYSVSISIINDQLSSHQILSASSGIILINGVGGLLGPLLGARAMSLFGSPSLYYFVAALNALLIGFTLYRMRVRPPVASDVPSELTAVVMPTSQVVVANAMDEADSGE